jgi:hypothetical protein
MAKVVVGVRTSRSAPQVFAEACDSNLARGTPLLVEVDGTRHLAFVDLPSDLLLGVPTVAVTGKVVEIGPASAAVASALVERDAAALVIARRILGPTVRVERAEWSLDRGWLTVVVAGELPTSLTQQVDDLAREVKAEIQFKSAGVSSA